MSVVKAATNGGPEDGLKNAISDFRASLTKEQQIDLLSVRTVPDAESIITFTAGLDAENRSRKGHSVGSRVYNVLRSVRDFCDVVDVYVSSHPEIAALVWGSVRLTMQIVLNYTSYYEAVCDLFMQIGELCPVFDEYASLYADSKTLQKSLVDFHASIIRCCKHVIDALNRPWFSHVLKAFHTSFNQEFQPDKDDLSRYSENVRISLDLAKAKDDMRRLAAISDKTDQHGNLFKAFASKADNHAQKQQEIWRREEERQAQKRKKQLLDALSPYDPEALLKQNQRKRHGSTASWIFDTPEFREWIGENGRPLLWCLGKIGSGKSVLTSSVVDYLSLAQHCPKGIVSYYFAHFSEPESLKLATVIRSLLRQRLPRKAKDLSDNIETRLEAILRDLNTSSTGYKELEGLIALFGDITRTSAPSYVVIDGFDEFDRSQQIGVFKTLALLLISNPRTKVFVSGRPSLSTEILKYRAIPCQSLTMEVGAQTDIPAYISGVVQEKLESGDLLVGSDDLVGDIEGALNRGADGMFLWVFFQMVEICAQTCDEDIRSTIADLPKDLQETYGRLLRRIATRKTEVPRKAFLWVAASLRPLTLPELREAIAIKIGQQFTEKERLCNDMNTIITACENLLHVDEEDRSVRFAHHTVKTFILQHLGGVYLPHLQFRLEDADHFIGEACLTYLDFNDFKTALTVRKKEVYISPGAVIDGLEPGVRKTAKLVQMFRSARISKVPDQRGIDVNSLSSDWLAATAASRETYRLHPFLKYAEVHWIFHTKGLLAGRSRTLDILNQLLLQGSNLAKMPVGGEPWSIDDPDLLDFALQSRHYALTRVIYKRMMPDPCISQHLFHCVRMNDQPFFDVALPCLQPGRMLNAVLFMASAYGRSYFLKRLIEFGADVNHVWSRDEPETPKWTVGSAQTALQVAAFENRLDVVDILLEAGSDPNVTRHYEDYFVQPRFVTALQGACYRGHDDVVTRLLLSAVDVNAPAASDYGLTALQAAAMNGHLDIVRRLLKRGARVDDPASPGGRGCTALTAAAMNGHHEVLEILLGSLHELVAPKDWTTALWLGSANGHTNVVKSLLGYHSSQQPLRIDYLLGIVQDARICFEKYYVSQTPLQAAALKGHLEIVQLLLQGNPSANAAACKDGGLTALQAAAAGGHKDIVRVLLDRGAEVNEPPAEHGGRTALQAAAGGGNYQIVDMLLSAGADVNGKAAKNYGRTALQCAVSGGYLGVVERILAAGAEINAVADGCTALDLAQRDDRSEVRNLLIKKGGRTTVDLIGGKV